MEDDELFRRHKAEFSSSIMRQAQATEMSSTCLRIDQQPVTRIPVSLLQQLYSFIGSRPVPKKVAFGRGAQGGIAMWLGYELLRLVRAIKKQGRHRYR